MLQLPIRHGLKIFIFENISEKIFRSMSLSSAVRPSLDIILDREEAPERHVSPRSKIMRSDEKVLADQKSYFFHVSL